MKPSPQHQGMVKSDKDINNQTKIGCVLTAVTFIVFAVIASSMGTTTGFTSCFFIIVFLGLIAFAVYLPIRGSLEKTKIREQAAARISPSTASSASSRPKPVSPPASKAPASTSTATPAQPKQTVLGKNQKTGGQVIVKDVDRQSGM